MAIPAEHKSRYVYHFSHVDNLAGLLKTGFLSNNHPKFPRKAHRSIAAASIQARRARMAVPCGPGGCVHDYVPMYFGSVSPMLLSVIKAKNVDQYDILYFEFPISLLERDEVIFSDASANTAEPPNFYSKPADLAKLNWAAIDSKRWGNVDDDFRHQRMAEMLVHNQLDLMEASRCVVWNDEVKREVEEIVKAAAVPLPPIQFQSIERPHWFTNFAEGGKSSLVKGPGEIAGIYEGACKAIAKERGKHSAAAPFKNLGQLLEKLREDFGSLPHTAELIGLKSENGIHKHPVDIHTKQVVDKLLTLAEYEELDEKRKLLVELAAYLHDIGKGPRSRWAKNNGLQKVDPNHPVGAMPMMVDILTAKVGVVSQESADVLTKLVCYHDLVGEVLGKGRDERQIADVVSDQRELDMLFALGKADATVLVETWWDDEEAEKLYQRCLSAIEARS